MQHIYDIFCLKKYQIPCSCFQDKGDEGAKSPLPLPQQIFPNSSLLTMPYTTDNQQQGTTGLQKEQEELTLWQAMFHSKQSQHNNDDVGTFVTTEDAIEKHRKEKEALYKNQQNQKERRHTNDSRGDIPDDGQKKKKNGFLACIRRRNSREEPEEVVPSATSFEFNTLKKKKSTEPWEGTSESVIQPKRDDFSQRTATYRQFGGNSLDNIKVEETKQVPLPSTPDHVVVKVTVSAENS